MKNKPVIIDGDSLTIEEFMRIVRGGTEASLSNEAKRRCEMSSKWIAKKTKEERPIYGLNTGFGSMERVRINKDELQKLQKNLILSHSAGVGKIAQREIVRGMMLLRANALASGCSGVRPVLIENILSLINNDVYPAVPEKGSVGASGDLAPLAHLALLLLGEGEAFIGDKSVTAGNALSHSAIEALSLCPKEGLALINGNQFSTSVGLLTIYDFSNLFNAALASTSLTLEALLAREDPFSLQYLKKRAHEGVVEIARCIKSLLKGSQLIDSDEEHVQDAYSIRCIPQVYATILSSYRWTRGVLEVEINSATDNPLVFPELNRVISGGNFHGEPIAVAMDLLGLAISNLGNITERQIMRLVSSFLSKGLPSFLSKREGLESGYMIAQYSAAALVSENKLLTHPASADSIPTSEDQEDYVSMAPISARKARDILNNTRSIIAIELLCSAEAIDIRTKGDYSQLGKGSRVVQELIREKILPLSGDRVIADDIKTVEELLKKNLVLERLTGIAHPFPLV